jgi:hypothetical protein
MATPSVNNYSLGKGIITFDRLVDGVPTGQRHLGNAPSCELQVEVTELEHVSSMSGIEEVDLTVVTRLKGMIRFTLEEYDLENLALALYGDVAGGILNAMSDTQVQGELKFIGNTDVGPSFNLTAWKVSLKPTGGFPLISSDWGAIPFEGTILKDAENHPAQPYFLMEVTNPT